jgi:hypothetical protein
MRKALVIGIDHYDHISPLYGCVNDAHSVKSVLERHSDGTVNFHVKLLTGTGPNDTVTRKEIRDAIQELFADDSSAALLYFAGHGHIDQVGGYLCASDTAEGDDGLSLTDVLSFANKSPARSKLVILDSCHSGVAGSTATNKSFAELSDGLSILTASTAEQYANEENGAGVFTTLLVDALNGAAANLVGEVTPGSVYAHIDQSLGPWQQRPIFRTNVKNFVSLRKVQPPIELADLQKITTFFPHAGYEFPLDPTFEPEALNPVAANTERFAILQRFNRVNLVVPVGETHMYHAAMNSRCCKLTVLGEHYRRLVERDLI